MTQPTQNLDYAGPPHIQSRRSKMAVVAFFFSLWTALGGLLLADGAPNSQVPLVIPNFLCWQVVADVILLWAMLRLKRAHGALAGWCWCWTAIGFIGIGWTMILIRLANS